MERLREGVAVWGASGISVCHCSVAALADWFRGVLAQDKAVAMEFEDFLVELGSGRPGT